ncbi:IST1 homolog isoform X5 [Heterocephalus glaber]|uniref:IST1 homolog n=1 Tax=Heterocephalus glaber TaxID=10181 RepID=A0AAX6SUA8_HETGA|nr:IST1 homolog isoform X5 [Heterocephalus glaber]
MFSSAFKVDRLRVNLQLVINRLKLLEKKKTEQTQKARKEIADFLAAGKDERARIQVEHIIREDYLVEAMEILELYCDLLLARINLIRATKELDSGLAESVSTLIWAAPRLQSEVPELKIVSYQLCAKYSQEYGQLCRTNEIGTVNSQLMYKLNVNTLPQVLMEQYLVEIAKNYNVPYKSKNDDYKNTLLPSVVPSPGLNPQTSPQPESRAKIGFRNSVLPDLPDVKPHTSRSIDTYDSEEVDFEDLNRRLEMLKKMT